MKVLVAIDSSPASQRILGEATARPWPEGAIFWVVNVADAQRFARFPILIEDSKREGDELVRAGNERLSRAVHKARS